MATTLALVVVALIPAHDRAVARLQSPPPDSEGELLIPRGCVDDNDSGPEECGTTSDGLDRPRSVVISPDGRSAYAVSEFDNAIVHFDRDISTGALTPQGCIEDNDSGADECSRSTDGLTNAIELAISPDGESVYVVSIGDSAVSHFSRNTTTGELDPESCIDDNDSGGDTCSQSIDGLHYANTVVVSPDGRSVYVGAQFDDAVVHFDRASNGDLTPRGCIDDNDTGADDCSQSADGLDGVRTVAVSPEGNSVYTVGFGEDDAVAHFERNTSTGELTPHGCIDDNDSGADACAQSTNGLDMGHSVTVSPDGRSVYAVGVGDSALVTFDRDAATGELTARGCIDDNDNGPDACDQSTDGLSQIAWVGVSPDNETVLASSVEGDHALVAFNRNTASGAITPAGCVDDNDVGADQCAQSTDGLQQAVFFAFTPDSRFVYVAGYDDDAIVIFEIGSGGQPDQCTDADAICGGSGDQDLQGTPEDEFIYGGGGNDTIDGGGGNDVIVGGTGNDVIAGGAGKDKITGGGGKDRILGDSRGSPSASAQVTASQAAASADQLAGGGGNDTILGQTGNDRLNGDAGNDVLKGGAGVNDFNGGPGRDTCVLNSRKDDTKSCEKQRNLQRNLYPGKLPA
jgi:6-phosphogluconolactonase (cycloisomerase 2 family)